MEYGGEGKCLYFPGWSGTETSPWLIRDIERLQQISPGQTFSCRHFRALVLWVNMDRKKDTGKSVDDIVRDLKAAGRTSSSYREQSLRIHGLVCAKCGREFGDKDRHLLTVHHRDGNHMNNPPDGSNWENLCIYCHDDEHSRTVLGDYLNKEED